MINSIVNITYSFINWLLESFNYNSFMPNDMNCYGFHKVWYQHIVFPVCKECKMWNQPIVFPAYKRLQYDTIWIIMFVYLLDINSLLFIWSFTVEFVVIMSFLYSWQNSFGLQIDFVLLNVLKFILSGRQLINN